MLATAAVAPASAQDLNRDNLERRWGPWIEFGGRTGAGRTLGEGNIFVPVWQGTHSLGFVDIRGSFDNRSAVEGNFGGGFRHMLDNGWNLGVYGHYDLRRSALGNTFHQATVGVEALGPWVDFRANAYIPLGQTEYRTVTGAFAGATTTSQAVLTGTSLGIQSVTMGTLTTTTSVERAMAGFDAEVGVRLPVFPESWKLDAKAFAGGYHFSAPGMGNISGPRARLELTSNDFAGLPGVKLSGGVTWQNDVRGDQWIASARLRIPLGAPQRSGRELTRQEERMLDPVFRDVDIVSDGRTETATQVTSVTTQTEDAINTWNNLRIASVLNVDAGIGGANVQSFVDNEQAVAGADGSVVVLNGELIHADGLNVNAGQTLLGGGTALRVRGATTGVEVDYVASGAAGSLQGTGTPPAGASFTGLINLGDRSVVGGMTLRQAGAGVGGAVIQAYQSTGSTAFGNRIYGGDAIFSHGIVFDNSTNGVASANTITLSNQHSTIGLLAQNSSTNILFTQNDVATANDVSATVYVYNSSARVVNNTLRPWQSGYALVASDATYLPNSDGNTIFGTTYVQCYYGGISSGTVRFTNAPDCNF